MATLDLKPLTQETIDQMAFNNHDLWLVKIHKDVFGPFETESLKHYASENDHQFIDAVATRMDHEDYKPFWTHTLFQRRAPQILNSDQRPGPFWLLDEGVKKGPYTYQDIDKKIEMDLVGMTDHISVDDGDTWQKIFEIHGFDRRTHSSEELPEIPVEASFQKAKLALVEKLENPDTGSTADQLASLAHIGHLEAKVIQFKVDEMTYQNSKQTEMSSSLKWAVPLAVSAMLAVVTTGFFMFSTSDSPEETPVVAQEKAPENFYQKKSKPRPQGFIPNTNRAPASTSYARPSQDQFQQESRYPTHMETHEQPFEERAPEAEFEQAATEDRPQEHSLVGNNQRNLNPNENENTITGAPEEHSLDAAMNGAVNGAGQPPEAPVEEASDF